ncbi:MAG: hypothetical protein A2445_02340 [Candidatus Jacksonbacteria bacterium RIFOXYC2_FULL_44_29]|nr:MAG: hypothetical protein UW45_C0047G0008 [Parcubacteria group bacterium GW2011_GWC2_44_22]OGY75496.1 MAG: hypothetical protein A2240_03215 [Candidatus Jacksonbacteria bacterium RIFOXYA2_FULL_43_12]OGY75842.1 MAG: hypothetical protein A2295_00215 [Candidatus Jacksonbacteria bacterium RIFOXYB2_FULL_44_15]OGY79081.1 MAG: hypothetical protein A2445_02340 [Candidatus Jacksonbacteria bacterium RIFOXYC2_FULL_44_29]OGY80261.1 MAG: hypothetical protein A2550_03985 [Candidatus Jacksonbacteria bacteri
MFKKPSFLLSLLFFIFLALPLALPMVAAAQSGVQTPPLDQGAQESPSNIVKLRYENFGLNKLAELVGIVKCTEEVREKQKVKICNSPDFREVLITILQYALGFTALIALIMVIFGGFTWATSAGSPERVTKGKNILTWALIGLVFIMIAWSVITFVMYFMRTAVSQPSA